VADVEACTAREWIRVGRQLADLSAIAESVRGGSDFVYAYRRSWPDSS